MLTEKEKEERRSLLLAKNLEETIYRREKSFREKDWSLWKILVVIAFIIFFLIIIFKARRAKD